MSFNPAQIFNKTVSLTRLARIAFHALTDKDPDRVVFSHTAFHGLSLKQQFNAASFYPQLLRKGQFIFFGDTNHSDTSLHKFFYSPENIQRMSEAGIRHIFPEMEPKYQNLTDKVVSGSITPEEYTMELLEMRAKEKGISVEKMLESPGLAKAIEASNNRGRGFALMGEMGMKIHCLDDRGNIDSKNLTATFAFINKFEDFATQNSSNGILHGKTMARFAFSMIGQIKKHGFEELQSINGLLKTRAGDDIALAERMKKSAGDERAAILFGAAHARSEQGLLNGIGLDRAVYIALYSNRELYADLMSVNNRDGISPDYTHILSEDKLFEFRGLKDLNLSL